MESGSGSGALWPADVIHVNEDGWVLINRGAAQGVPVGLRLLVVGQGIREMRDLFANAGVATETPPVAHLRRTYELLEVAHVEEQCAVAIATRAPAERRPQFYRGPEGELLVWVPLPADYTWPLPETTASDGSVDIGEADDADNTSYGAPQEEIAEDAGAVDAGDASSDAETPDEPPERITQEDERWEEALPLNGVSVGDRVVPAIPATPATPISSAPGATTATTTDYLADSNVPDWMKPS